MDSDSKFDSQDRIFIRVWAASLLLLLSLTWKLWLPGFTEFPRVPIFGVQFVGTLLPVHCLATAALVIGLLGIVGGFGNVRRWLGLAAVSLAALFLCNQHCLQPWAWQAFIVAILLCSLPKRESKIWIRWLLISIYVFSAIGKFDYQFVHTVGSQFINTMLTWLGLDSYIDTNLVSRLVLAMPVGEALIAFGLSMQKTRRIAAWLAIILHVVLIALLSPWGLGHQPPVLIWNGVSILLVIWLFLLERESNRPAPSARSRNVLPQLTKAFALLVLLGPLLRPAGLWDHWLAWGLYSPSNSRVEANISENALPRVSPLLQPFFAEEGQFGVLRFSMEDWSLEELGVPVYPQARFQREVVAEVLRQQDLVSFAKVIQYSQSHPLSGTRSKREIDVAE